MANEPEESRKTLAMTVSVDMDSVGDITVLREKVHKALGGRDNGVNYQEEPWSLNNAGSYGIWLKRWKCW